MKPRLVLFTSLILLAAALSDAGIESPGGNPVIGGSNNAARAGAQGPAAVVVLLQERFMVEQIPMEKHLLNQNGTLQQWFEYEGYLLEFLDYDSTDPTKLIITSFFDDPNTHLRTMRSDIIQNTSSAQTWASIRVDVKGRTINFGPWQAHAIHIINPQDLTSPPAPDPNTIFTEDWQDTTLENGLSIQRYNGAVVSIEGGTLTITGNDFSYVIITLPAGVVCLAMYGIDVSITIPTLSNWGIAFLTGALLFISIYLMAVQRRKQQASSA